MKFFSLLRYVRDVVGLLGQDNTAQVTRRDSGKLLSSIVRPTISIPALTLLPVISYVISKSSLDFSKITEGLSRLSALVDRLTGTPDAKNASIKPITSVKPDTQTIPSGQGNQYGIVRKTPSALGLADKLPPKGSYTPDEANQIQSLVSANADTSAYKTKMNPKIEELIRSKALEYGVNPDIAVKIAVVESGGNPNAISSTGAIGVFQFTGASASLMGLANRFNIYDNIDAGIRLIAADKKFVGKFDSNVATYLALQIGGPNAKYILNLDRSTKISELPARVQATVRGNLGGKSTTIGEYIDINAEALESKLRAQSAKPVYRLAENTSSAPSAQSSPMPSVVSKSSATNTVTVKESAPTQTAPNYKIEKPNPPPRLEPTTISTSSASSNTSSSSLEGLIRHKSGLYFNAS